jgi:hypothetical protein
MGLTAVNGVIEKGYRAAAISYKLDSKKKNLKQGIEIIFEALKLYMGNLPSTRLILSVFIF